MYAKNAIGGFRLRASFPISPDLVEGLNAISARSGQSVATLCRVAVQRLVNEYALRDGNSGERPLSVTAGGEA